MIPWQSNPLSPDETQRKITAIQCHATQYAVSEKFLKSFLRNNELFGDYPTSKFLSVQRPTKPKRRARRRLSRRMPEGLSGTQKTKFVGVESRSLRLVGDRVFITIDFSGLLSGGVEAEVSIMGYRSRSTLCGDAQAAYQVQRCGTRRLRLAGRKWQDKTGRGGT